MLVRLGSLAQLLRAAESSDAMFVHNLAVGRKGGVEVVLPVAEGRAGSESGGAQRLKCFGR